MKLFLLGLIIGGFIGFLLSALLAANNHSNHD